MGRLRFRRSTRLIVVVAIAPWIGGAAASHAGQAPGLSEFENGTAPASLVHARSLIASGNFKQAADLLAEYLKTDSGSASGHEMLAYSYQRLNDPRRSLEEYNRLAAIKKPTAADLQNVAKDYVLLGDTANAEHWMLKSVQMDDRDPEGWYGLGRVRYTLQRFQEAVDCFQRSLALQPRSVKAENNLGLAYEGLNRTDEAIAAYRQAIAWQQNDPHPSEQPLLNLGIVLVHQAKLEEARPLLTQAAAIAPEDGRIREQLGHLYLQMNRLTEAEQQLEAAIKLEPKKAALHFLLGKVYHLQGQEQKAKAEFAVSASLSGYRATPDTD